jgi:hypothetical protein
MRPAQGDQLEQVGFGRLGAVPRLAVGVRKRRARADVHTVCVMRFELPLAARRRASKSVVSALPPASAPERRDTRQRNREEKELEPAAATVGSNSERALDEVHPRTHLVVARLLGAVRVAAAIALARWGSAF